MNLTKSLAVAGGVTGGVIGAVLLAGIITNEEFDTGGGGGIPQTLRLNSIPVRLGGYGLERRRGEGAIAILSISLKVTGDENKSHVCRMAPRLVATVTRDVAARFAEMEDLDAARRSTLPEHLRHRFNQTLEGAPVDSVMIDRVESGEIPPRGTCG
ncbi:MAG: hypothetical protein CMM61_09340 [Rhodospirillaceae bacterium]|nr:hypothetical protein [Rhodospirillaceae bacterium]